jgi:hypothetical protein
MAISRTTLREGEPTSFDAHNGEWLVLQAPNVSDPANAVTTDAIWVEPDQYTVNFQQTLNQYGQPMFILIFFGVFVGLSLLFTILSWLLMCCYRWVPVVSTAETPSVALSTVTPTPSALSSAASVSPVIVVTPSAC